MKINNECTFRDFDPCFGEDPLDPSEESEAEDSISSDGVPPLKTSISHLPSGQNTSAADISSTEITKTNSTEKIKKSLSPKNKFPLGPPKKINFGPPKPPRSFDCASVEELKRERRIKSPKELFGNQPSKPVQSRECSTDDIDELKTGNNNKKAKDVGREDNLYVALPVRSVISSQGPDNNKKLTSPSNAYLFYRFSEERREE